MLQSPLFPVARLSCGSTVLYRIYDGRAVEGAGQWVKLVPSTEAFWIIRSGFAEIRMGKRRWRVGAGGGMCLGMGAREQFFSEDARLLSINHVWKDADGRPHFLLPEPHQFAAVAARDLVAAAEQFSHEVALRIGKPALMPSSRMNANDYQSVIGAFHYWLASYGEYLDRGGFRSVSEVPIDPRLLKARRLLDQVPLDQAIDYATVAGRAGISRTQLERLFRTHFATTPHAYFQRRRAEYACQALLQPGIPIKAISLNLGFRHLSRFSAWFSSREHNPPRAYRRAFSQVSHRPKG